MSFIRYNPKLKQRARDLRNNSTPSEVRLWTRLRAGQMNGYTFNRQKPLGKYIVDFYCRKLGLVIEIDGDSHDAKQRYDARRQRTLEKLGLTILRFTDREVMKHLEGVLVEIQRTVGELELANKS